MKEISIKQLKEKLDNKEDFLFLDVREPEEFAEVNINAKLFPLSKLQQGDVSELEEYKDKPIIVHCRSGKRSMMACMILETLGYSNLTNVEGGILAWLDQYPQ